MDTPLASAPDEAARLRRCLNDLVSVVALPASWDGGGPSRIVSTMLDALVTILNPAFVSVRLHDPEGAPIETTRVAESWEGSLQISELRRTIETLPHSPTARVVMAGTTFYVASARLGLHADIGTIVVGSPRTDFPGQTERLILDVAANQATLGLQRARESERESQLIVDSIPGLVALLSASGEVERVNPQISEYTGKTLEALKQWGTNGIVHPEDLPHVIEIFSRSIASGQSYEIAQRLRRADGAYRWFQNNGHPIRDVNGKVVRWCVLLTDINERKRAEDALRESERESRLIVDTIPGLVATLTPTGELEFVNNQVLSYCGRTLEEVKRWSTSDLVHPDDLAHANHVVSQSIASGEPYDIEERIRRFDGIYRWFQIRGLPLHDSEGGIVRWYVLLTDIDERRRAEEEVRARERFRAIVDELPVMVTLMTPAGEFADGNRHMLDYFDAPLDELKRRPTTFSFHPDDRPAVDAQWRESVETGTPYDHEARLRRGDGTYRWFHTRGFPLRDAEGHIVLWHLLQTDVDDRKRAEEAVRASERELKQIIDTIPALAWSARVDGTVEFLSQHYLSFIGLSADAVAGWGWTTAIHPDDVGRLSATWQRIMSSEAPGEAEARLRRHDGEYRWFLFRTNPLRDADGRIVKWYGVNTDIEDRKRAEVELRRAYDSFADAQRLSHTGNFTADVVADEHVWSEELYRIFEFEPDMKIRVQAVRDVIHPDDLPLFDAGFARSLHGADFDLVFRIVTKSGKVKHVRSLARVLERVAGRPVFIGAIQDVTETKNAEEALNKARSELAHVSRVTTLSTLTASIAHEVSQPLSGIITNAGTCLRMLDSNPVNVQGARETARRTIRDSQRASEVITRLRALFSRKEFTLESLNLNEAIQEVIALSRNDLQRQRVVLHADLAEDLPNVTGDRVQLQQVILNLLRNASDAMVDVRDRRRQLLIRTQRDGDEHVRVGVRDNGVGIDPQNVNKLFDAFYTTKTDGMGIGLSVSRSIVERHHGRLWVEPNDGPGAHFILSVPCHYASEP